MNTLAAMIYARWLTPALLWIEAGAVRRFVVWTTLASWCGCCLQGHPRPPGLRGLPRRPFRLERGTAGLAQPAGVAFLIVLLHLVGSIPFSRVPMDSIRDLVKSLDLVAGMAAIPVLFHTRPRRERALGYSAAAITLILAADWCDWGGRWDRRCSARAVFQAVHHEPPERRRHDGRRATFMLTYFVWQWRHARRGQRPAASGCSSCSPTRSSSPRAARKSPSPRPAPRRASCCCRLAPQNRPGSPPVFSRAC